MEVGVDVFVTVGVLVGVGASVTTMLPLMPVIVDVTVSVAPTYHVPSRFKATVNACTPASDGWKVYATGRVADEHEEVKVTVPA